MIVRYSVKCPSCGSIILIRMSIGLDEKQPFFFICSKCNSPTKGTQIIWYDPEPGSKLELDEGEEVEEPVNPDQIITIHPDLPAYSNATDMASFGGSPFLLQRGLLGDRFDEFIQRSRVFRKVTNTDWKNYRRWLYHYLDRNWTEFDKIGHTIFEEKWPNPKTDLQRHDTIHKALDFLTVPLWLDNYYPLMKKKWIELWNDEIFQSKNNSIKFHQFAKEENDKGNIVELQRDIFHCLTLFMENRSGILPALAAMKYKNGHEAAIKELRIFRDDFPALRDLYINAFETSYKSIVYLLAPINIIRRKHYGIFSDGYNSIAKFEKLPSAKKRDFIKQIDGWLEKWDSIYDRKLRNAIGHHSARHELSSGMILIKKSEPIPYIEFLMKVIVQLQGIVLVSNILKTIAIWASRPPKN